MRDAQASLNHFFKRLYYSWVDGACDIDGCDVQEWMVECGLVDQVDYDPEKHPNVEADDGDVIYVLRDDVRALLPKEIA